MSPDHQVAALLLLAGLIGAVIWTLRCIDTWAARKHAAILASMRRHPSATPQPEYEHAAPRWHKPAPCETTVRQPGLQTWTPGIEDQIRAGSTDAEIARLEQWANDLPFDQEKQ